MRVSLESSNAPPARRGITATRRVLLLLLAHQGHSRVRTAQRHQDQAHIPRASAAHQALHAPLALKPQPPAQLGNTRQLALRAASSVKQATIVLGQPPPRQQCYRLNAELGCTAPLVKAAPPMVSRMHAGKELIAQGAPKPLSPALSAHITLPQAA